MITSNTDMFYNYPTIFETQIFIQQIIDLDINWEKVFCNILGMNSNY